jgi:hypothetical protein
MRKKLGEKYDKIFHLALIATIEINGQLKNIVIEKEATINISTHYKTKDTTEIMYIPLKNKNLTINEMLEKTRKTMGDKLYFGYSALQNNNCQNYIMQILINSDLLDENAFNFIFQPIQQIVKNMPFYMKTLTNKITGFKALLDKLIGKGI